MGKFRQALGAGLLCALFSATAAAQTTVAVVGVAREKQSRLPTSQINLADCLADDRVKLTLTFGPGYASYGLEIWAGDACDLLTSRVGSAARCWRIFAGSPTNITDHAEFGVRDFLRGRTRARTADAADGAACELDVATVLPQSLTAHVMLLDSNGDLGGYTTWKAQYRLVTSPPPDRILTGIADGEAPIVFSYDNADPVASDVQFYCDPPPNDPDAIAKGALVARDADAGAQVCSESNQLVEGAPAASMEHLRCGSARATEGRGSADGLVNGVAYNVAAATVDTFGNVGALSELVCATPQAKPAGDTKAQACSLAGTSPMRRGSALAFVVILGSALARRRRRA